MKGTGNREVAPLCEVAPQCYTWESVFTNFTAQAHPTPSNAYFYIQCDYV